MKATGFNHVSINAHDLEEPVRFYTEVLGMEKIPTYNFGFPVQYLRLGDLQLHIFEREETEAPTFHHFGVDAVSPGRGGRWVRAGRRRGDRPPRERPRRPRCDMLVCADGIRSWARQILLPHVS